LPYVPVERNHGEHGKGLGVRNNQLVSYFNSQDVTEREQNIEMGIHCLKMNNRFNKDDTSVIELL